MPRLLKMGLQIGFLLWLCGDTLLQISYPPFMLVSPLRLLWIWTAIGMQSFGGGSATLYLIRRVAVERHGWITDEDFTRYWGICQIAPGINILGLVVLIGWRVAGAVGAALSLCGLLLPSAAITVALTSIYASVREAPLVRAAIAGVVPATVGLGLFLGFTMTRPLLNSARREGSASTLIAIVLLLASTIVAARAQTPVLAILYSAGAVSAIAQWQLAGRQKSEEGPRG
ncbi:MAG TPA: chromate transporter [Terriglobia bacterium]|nr:chromate transporter [Terriglobia bacterium]